MRLIIALLLISISASANSATVIISAVASALAVSTLVATIIVAVGAMILAKLLAPKADLGLMTKDPKALIKSATEAKKYIYGEMIVGGTIVFKHKQDDRQYYVIALCAHEVEEISTVYINQTDSEDEKFNPITVKRGHRLAGSELPDTVTVTHHVHIERMLGGEEQEANPWLVSEIDKWTSEHRLRGIAYLIIKINPDRSAFPQGIKSITAKVKGKKVYDPRTGKTLWSSNPALCILDWIKSDYGFNAPDREINENSFFAAANICDEMVGEYTRYTTNGVIDGGVDPKKVLEDMLCHHATIAPTAGQYNLFVGAYETPTRSISEDDLAGDIRCTPVQSAKTGFNSIKVIYFNEDAVKKETSPQQNQRYIDEDGELLKAEIALPFTNTPREAQRIAKIALEQDRQGMTIELTLKLTCVDLYVGQFISVTLPTLGLSSKPFLCQSWSLGKGGVKVLLRETHSSIWDWNDGEFLDQDPAPNTTLPSPYDVGIPKNVVVISGNQQLKVRADGTIISGMLVTFEKEEYYRAEVSYKKDIEGEDKYIDLPITESNSYYIIDVEDGEFYTVTVRLQNILGVWSPYIVKQHKVLGKTAKPSNVSDLTVTVMPDGTRLFRWEKVNDLDLSGYVVKYGDGGWDAMTSLYDGVITTNTFESNALPKGNYTFAVKAVDTSANESENANFVTADLGDPRLGDSILYKAYKNNWGTVPSSVGIGGGKLFWSGSTIAQLDAQFLTVSGWGTWVPISGNFTFITETFDLTQQINILPYLYADSDGTSTVKMATSNDGTTFTAWVDLGVIQPRYIKFKIDFVGVKTVNDIVVNLTGKSKQQILNDLDTSTLTYDNGIVLPISGFSLVGNITVVMQNVGPGFTYEVVSKIPPKIKIYNALNQRSNAIIDVTINGL